MYGGRTIRNTNSSSVQVFLIHSSASKSSLLFLSAILHPQCPPAKTDSSTVSIVYRQSSIATKSTPRLPCRLTLSSQALSRPVAPAVCPLTLAAFTHPHPSLVRLNLVHCIARPHISPARLASTVQSTLPANQPIVLHQWSASLRMPQKSQSSARTNFPAPASSFLPVGQPGNTGPASYSS